MASMKPLYQTGFYGGKFLPLHIGHIDCIMRAASQCEKLYVVLMHNADEEQELLKGSAANPSLSPVGFPPRLLTPHVRELALRQATAWMPNVQVIVYDCHQPDRRAKAEGRHPWFYECQDMVQLMGRFDAAFTSEPSYCPAFNAFYPWADAILLDPDRSAWPVSGTALRKLPLSQAYPFLPRSYQVLANKKVLLAGTESCGKTTLIRKLATVFNTTFTEEHGRLVGESFGMSSPGAEFYNGFLFAQKAREERAVQQANRVAFCDSDALTTAFYAQRYEGVDLPIAQAMAAEHDYDLAIYIEPTVPWVDDGTRTDSADEIRWKNDAAMKELYRKAGIPLHVLSGTYEENYRGAVQLVKELLDA